MSELKKRVVSSMVILPLSFYFIIKGSVLFLSFLFFCFLISCYEWNKMAKDRIILILGAIFLFISFYCAYSIRENLQDIGLFVFLFLIIISISTDIGGFTCGKIFKGPKITKISPKKTYTGMIGSFLFSIILGLMFVNLYPNLSSFNNQSAINLILLILCLSFISQIGDLIISYFKRISKIDNSGNLIPGHGGILDRIDGIIFVIPFFYLLNSLFKIV
tara:strand:+ start:1196 stop:1849 length:654 start_codon:yes stop_codon:yes gene_type:complete